MKDVRLRGDQIDLVAVRHGLPVLDQYAYLNAGTFGPLPRATAGAMQAVERRELEEGRSSRAYFQRVMDERDELRAELAGLLGTQPEQVALTSSTTEGCNIVLRGLRRQCAVQQQRRHQLLPAEIRIEVASGPPGRQRVVARVDIVRAHLEARNRHSGRAKCTHQPGGHSCLVMSRTRSGDHQPGDLRHR